MAGSTRGRPAAAAFGPLLRALRDAAGLSQDELASRAGVSVDAIGALERGARKNPYPATVRALAEGLDLGADDRAALLAAVPRRVPGPTVPSASAPDIRGGLAYGVLPVPPTPLHGRDADVREVVWLFESGARLVTVTGLGGIGKTRLAIAAADRLSSARRDGVAFVALAAINDAGVVLPEIARSLGVEVGFSTSEEMIARAVDSREVLLVLDNFEHVAAAASGIANLLMRCPRLWILATSRAPLDIRGEREYQVGPLGLPGRDAHDLADLVIAPSAELLLERARAVRPHLVIRPEDVPAVAEICHRLAGLPLALELAAAGLRVLTPTALLERLDDVLSRSGPVDLPARQHTMRTTLDWSRDLLSGRDQSVFRRISVFVGGCTLEAAEAVAGGPDVLDSLESLVRQSLCRVDHPAAGEPRFVMLEPVVQYARSQLGPEEEAEVRRAHAEYFAALADRSAAEYGDADWVRWLARFEPDDGNLTSAVEWAVGEGAGEMAGRLTWGLWWYWWIRGRVRQGRRLVDLVLSMDLPDLARTRSLAAAVAMAEPGVDPDGVARWYNESLMLARRCGDSVGQATASLSAGLGALEREDYEIAAERLRAALVSAEEAGRPGRWVGAMAYIFLGTVLRMQGHADQAVAEINAGLASCRDRQDPVTAVVALYNLGQTELVRGDAEAARAYLLEAVQLCQDSRDAPNLSFVLDAMAAAEAESGSPERMAMLLGAAEGMRDLVGSTVYGYYNADVALRRRTVERAREKLGESAFRRNFDAGRLPDLDRAIALARAESPSH